jgi:predicted acyltransferase
MPMIQAGRALTPRGVRPASYLFGEGFMEAPDSAVTPPPVESTALPPLPPARISSLDQFRGYTVAGMFLVNYLASFAVTPAVLKHHNTYCSYADTIMPQFFFAVGFAFRLTFGRRAASAGLASAYFRVARRFIGLALVAIVFYTYLDGNGLWHGFTGGRFWPTLYLATKRIWFQTLMHIAVTSIWILPVIRSSSGVRILYLLFSAGLHVFLSYEFNVTWINTDPTAIDGGPLGFLTWSIPTLAGTLACDLVMGKSTPAVKFSKMLAWSVLVMLLGYGLSCGTRLYDVSRLPGTVGRESINLVAPPLEKAGGGDLSSYLAEPPFVGPPDSKVRLQNYWMMSQRYCSVSYQVFSAGFSLLIYALFYLVCDQWGWHVGAFRTLGRNALTGYIVGILIQRMIKTKLREIYGTDISAWQVMAGFVALFVLTWGVLRILEWRKIYVRL